MMKRLAAILLVSLCAAGAARAGEQDLDGLLKQIGDGNAGVREKAVDALAEIGAPAVGPLVKLMCGSEAAIANSAKAALFDVTVRAGRPGSSRRAAVSQALADACGATTNPEVWEYLARMIDHVGDEEVVPMLAKALNDKALREPARRALTANPSASAGATLREWLGKAEPEFRVGIINALGSRRDAAAVPALIEQTKDADEQVRLAAVEALARIPDARSLAAINDAATKSEGRSKFRAETARLGLAETLAAAGQRDAAEGIYSGLMESAKTDRERCAAIAGLGKVGGAKATAAILGAAGSDSVEVRGAAAAALRSMRGGEVTGAITGHMEKSSPAVRAALLTVLAMRGDRAGLPAAVKALKDKDADVRVAALGCVGKLGDASAVKDVVEASRDAKGPELEAAEEALGTLARGGATGSLIESLGTASPRQRATIYRAIGAQRDGKVLETLLAGAKDADRGSRIGALKALGLQPDPKALAALMDAAADDNEAVRSAALQGALYVAAALEEKDRAGSLNAYHRILQLARQPKQQGAALEKIARIGDPQSLEPVKPWLKDGNVAQQAADAVLAIAAKLGPDRKDEAVQLVRTAVAINPGSGRAKEAIEAVRKLGADIDLAREAGFVTCWWLAGPFPNPNGEMWDKAYPPERGVDLAASYEAGGQKLAWKAYRTPDVQGIVDLTKAIAEQSNVGAYGYAEVTVEGEQDALFKMGSDDQVICRLNGQQIHANKASRGTAPDQDTVKVRLKAGKNQILMKVLNGGGGWGFCLRITDPKGKALAVTQREK